MKEYISHPEKETSQESWIVVSHPGYLGSRKEEMMAKWDEVYGKGNWRLGWQTAEGQRLTFDDIFAIYIRGYVEYFRKHSDEAQLITQKYAYAYDETPVSKADAFTPDALWEKPGISNQFHHAALNIALEKVLGRRFKGQQPVQVRAGKLEKPVESWPEGWRWHPGRIPCPNHKLIPEDPVLGRKWHWEENSIEDFYQKTKVLEIRKP